MSPEHNTGGVSLQHAVAHQDLGPGRGAWGVWSWPSDPNCCCGAKGKYCACVHSLLIVGTAWHASGDSAPIHGHIKAIKVQTLMLTNRHLIQITFIRFLPYILQKFPEGDSESEALPPTAAECLLPITSLTYTPTSIMRRIPKYLTNNNPCSLNEIFL